MLDLLYDVCIKLNESTANMQAEKLSDHRKCQHVRALKSKCIRLKQVY